MGQLSGLVCVITGGGRGIGRAIAMRYAAEGAIIVISSRTPADLEGTLELAGVDAGRGLAVTADATKRSDARWPVERALARFGRVDVLVNNVGGHVGQWDTFNADDDAFEQTMVLSLTSAWWTTSAALPAMKDQAFGRIINVGSGAAKRTGGSVPYVTAKHGLVGLTRQVASDVARYGITANCLCPGWTRTSLLDFERVAARRGTTAAQEEQRAGQESLQHRVLDADEIGGMATLLAGPDGRGITGQVLSVDGGYKI